MGGSIYLLFLVNFILSIIASVICVYFFSLKPASHEVVIIFAFVITWIQVESEKAKRGEK